LTTELDEVDPDEFDPELDELVRKIFDIIPSYYHEGQARLIAAAVTEYVSRKFRERE
jgi:hypothetical protein